MKKTLIAGLVTLTSLPTFANCIVEMQYQGTRFGQNIFQGQTCRDAKRECNKTLKAMEREVMVVTRNATEPFFMEGDLTCATVNDVNPGPGNGGNNGNGGNSGGIGNGPTPMDPNPMSRYEALMILEDIENDRNQADQDFEIIMSYVNQGVIFTREAVDVFVAAINSTEASSTSDAQRVFSNVMEKFIQSGVTPMEYASIFVNSNRIENDNSQAEENLNMIYNLMPQLTEMPAQAAAEFHRVLNKVGSGSTTEARSLFTTIVNTKRAGTRLSRVVDIAIDIQTRENNASQTGENIALVNQAASISGVTFSEAANTMISLLDRYGAGSTTTV